MSGSNRGGGAEWVVETARGSAADLHHRQLPVPLRPTAWIHQVDEPSLVLGSTQQTDDLDTQAAAARGWAISQRRSGGGLVAMTPTGGVWIDILIPRGHSRWHDDIAIATHWLGKLWAEVLTTVAPQATVTMHTGPWQHRQLGRLVCFAGLAAGEVTVNGSKVLGISQRRTRDAARFQTYCLLDPHLDDIIAVGGPAVASAASNAGPMGWPANLPTPTTAQLVEAFRSLLGTVA